MKNLLTNFGILALITLVVLAGIHISGWVVVLFILFYVGASSTSKTDDKDLVDFGNYLLSIKRDEMTSDKNKQSVTDADLKNFKNKKS